MIRELLCKCSILLPFKLLSDRILLYSSKAPESVIIAFTNKEPRTYIPSNVVTLLKAT